VHRELDAPDFVKHAHVDVVDVEFEELKALLDAWLHHVGLHHFLETLVLVGNIHHEDGDVEALQKLLVFHPLLLDILVLHVLFGVFEYEGEE